MRFDAKQLKEMSKVARADALRAIAGANSGHVGIVMDAAEMMTVVYANFLRRGIDQFILSAGHGSALLYSVLKLAGYNIADLKSFRQIGGLAGHPEFGTDGVAATTGPLGQGVGNAVGYALAAKINGTDGRVFCLCSDGDLMEGVAQESIAFAGQYCLNNLVLLWDDNSISIDGVAITDVDMPTRMLAAGWDVFTVSGDDTAQIDEVLQAAGESDRPVFIQCVNLMARGTRLAGHAAAHGLAFSADELLNLADENMSERGAELWAQLAATASRKSDSVVPYSKCPKNIKLVHIPERISTRELSGIVLEQLMANGARLIGGSADLSASTNAKTKYHTDIIPDDFVGNFINYGVREHAMGAIMNGMAAAGLRPYGSTFLVFSDYMRPSIRLAALSRLPVIYVFSHDSVAVGADGPTHQPIEQLASLRLIPRLNVFRPCNGAEVAYAWCHAIRDVSHPTAIVLSRQSVRQVPSPDSVAVSRGAYVIYPSESKHIRATLIATGAEVPLAIAVAQKLGRGVQVVSMPCVSVFRAQDNEYKNKILQGFVVAIEAGASAAWFEFADAVVGVDTFGISGDGADVYKHCGFDADIIARDIAPRIK